MRNLLLASVLLLGSCAPSTVEDFRCEGESQTKAFAQELRKIETRDQLQASLPKIKKRFNRMADLLIAVHQYRMKEPLADLPAPSLVSDELFAELARLYELPNGREWIELAQSEAVDRLNRHLEE